MQVNKMSTYNPNFGLKICKDKNFANIKKYWRVAGWSEDIINQTVKKIEGINSKGSKLTFTPIYKKTDYTDVYVKEDICGDKIVRGVQKDAVDFSLNKTKESPKYSSFLEGNSETIGTYRNKLEASHPDYLYLSILESIKK